MSCKHNTPRQDYGPKVHPRYFCRCGQGFDTKGGKKPSKGPSEKRDIVLKVTKAEFDTILAGLRCWHQFISEHSEGDQGILDEIASDGGSHDPLNYDEVDQLAERLNS